MNFITRRIALFLSLCNISAAAINLLAIIFYSWFFGLKEIGILATVTSISAMLMPLVNFRLDLAFQRLPAEDRPGLVALILVWGAAVGFVFAVIGLFASFILGWLSPLIMVAIPMHLMLSSANSAIWAQKVCDRQLSHVAVLQIVRALLAAGLPFILATQMDGGGALIYGQIVAQLTFLLFLPQVSHFKLDRLRANLFWIRSMASDLILENTLPLLVNSTSLHVNPVLAAAIFGPEAAAIIWMIFRLFLNPASMIADPVRRDFYANYTDGYNINRDVRRPILIYKGVTFGLGISFLIVGGVASHYLNLPSAVAQFGEQSLIFGLGSVWAGAILFNAPSTGLIPVLRMAKLQTVVEMIGFIVRIGSLLLGLLNIPLEICLSIFLGLTIVVNLIFGAIIDWEIWRK